jgi:hypothetical protein
MTSHAEVDVVTYLKLVVAEMVVIELVMPYDVIY